MSSAAQWGTHWRQRLRLAPLYWALRIGDALARRPRAPPAIARSDAPGEPGISVVIPERDAAPLLATALDSLVEARGRVAEPVEIIVVASGAPAATYAPLVARFADVDWLHQEAGLGFLEAVERGVARARHSWVYLLNNDMRVEPDALHALLSLRARDVFAIASQIVQRSADGRQEETGFTDWFVDHAGIQMLHAPVRGSDARPHLVASGGASLFRRDALARYLGASHAYDPFYWEDAEWSVRAWRDGYRVLFCPASRVHHAHRATTTRLHSAEEIARIVERNRILFDARHGASGRSPTWLMQRICDLPYASQRELSAWRHARGVLAQRRRRDAAQPLAPPVLSGFDAPTRALSCASYTYRLGCAGESTRDRARVALVTPFAAFPARHGGARRVAALAHAIAARHDVVLVTDEAALHDARSFSGFDGLHAVQLTQRREKPSTAPRARRDTMTAHCHPGMQAAVREVVQRYRPGIVQIEHVELAPLIALREEGQRWVLGLHDAVTAADFANAGDAAWFASSVLARYDAVTVCSEDDRALIDHPRVVSVPNGMTPPAQPYMPSTGAEILFVGPFRYAPNLRGIVAFVQRAWPRIVAQVPHARLRILGGDESTALASTHPELGGAGITLMGHRDDVPDWLARSALTINPLVGIRGSAIKLVESLASGRVCVSTTEGARGFAHEGFDGLVLVDDVAAMSEPVIALLLDADARHRREQPAADALAPFRWDACAAAQMRLYETLLGTAHG